MRTKTEILKNLDYRPTCNSHRNPSDVSSRSIEAIAEVLIDIRDELVKMNERNANHGGQGSSDPYKYPNP